MANILTVSPKNLYRYRAIANESQLQQELNSISHGYVWCSKFDCLNDPMEGSYKLEQKSNPESSTSHALSKLYDEKAALGICSFSETNDNATMWAHYANAFQGICLEYDFNCLIESLEEGDTLVRVTYSEAARKLSDLQLNYNDEAKQLLATKGHHWLYEREWRLISPEQGPRHFALNSITGIYFGSRTTLKNKWWIRSSAVDLPLWEMSFDGYSIQFSAEKPGA